MSSSYGSVNSNTDYLIDDRDPEAVERTLSRIKDHLDELEVTLDGVLVAVYNRPEKTKGGIIRPDSRRQEDVWQGKTGLVVKMGPDAFVDKPEAGILFKNKAEVGSWVGFNIQDGWIMQVAGIFCRQLRDRSIKVVLTRPDLVY
jgi:co-chaperonin GroES (HSP10)